MYCIELLVALAVPTQHMRSVLLSSFSRLGNWRGLVPPLGPSVIKTRCRKAQNNNQVQQQHTRYEGCCFVGGVSSTSSLYPARRDLPTIASFSSLQSRQRQYRLLII